jgi:FkbM family methyltransferase
MKYDFVEIGTSDFDTLISKADKGEKGISIDAVSEYSQRLDIREGVKVLNLAVSDFNGYEKVYFVNPEDVESYSLPHFIKGCGRLGEKHPHVLEELEKRNLLDLYREREVEVLTFGSFCEKENITQIYHLKIDTEGSDYRILNSLLSYGEVFPEIIEFELHPDLNSSSDFNTILNRFFDLGYKVERRKMLDVILKRVKNQEGNPRITVVATYDDNYKEMAEITIHDNFKKYCEIHGFDLHVDRMESRDEKRVPQWHKIKLLIDLLKKNKSDWFFFIDADCLFMNFSKDLSSFIDNDYILILPETEGAPDFELTGTHGINNLLSAQMLVKNSPKSLEFFEKVWEASEWPEGMDINEFDHEMRQIRILVGMDEWKNSVKVLEQKSLNSFWYVNNPHMHIYFPNINQNGWYPGDFIVHVVGYPTQERVSILSQLSMFSGGKIYLKERTNSNVWIKPQVHLKDVVIDMYDRDGNFIVYWEFEEMNKNIYYYIIYEGDINNYLFIISTTSCGEISRFKFDTKIQDPENIFEI